MTQAETAVRAAVDPAIDAGEPLVLAVSGGRDSMCLMHAVANHPRRRGRVVVASFDHGTGTHATNAVSLVRGVAHSMGLEFVEGSSGARHWSEAAWRDARWAFLRDVADRVRAAVVTAHHHDDHLETLVMRALRGAGPRGMAGLRVSARGDVRVLRPFLELGSSTLTEYARVRGVTWRDDPTNQDPAFFRNRVRRDLLPALCAADPSFGGAMDRVSRAAAVLRAQLDRVAATLERSASGGVLSLDATVIDLPEPGRSLVWGALLQRAGVVLDRRGYERLNAITVMKPGDEVQLSGRVSVSRTGSAVCVHRHRATTWAARELVPEGVRVGPWRFEVSEWRGASDTWGVWGWPAPSVGVSWRVRPWRGGDRWRGPGCDSPRLVARFLAEAGVPSSAREGWPVVETNGEIVWVPGTRRASAAPASPGGVLRLVRCEYIDR
jgi:tRNA(Ile)-lysidine synthase